MNAQSPDQYADKKTLLNYYFSNFKALSIADNENSAAADNTTDLGVMNEHGMYAKAVSYTHLGFIYLVKLMIARHGCLYLKMIEQLVCVCILFRRRCIHNNHAQRQAILLRISDKRAAVSYTHLDVYKRQLYYSFCSYNPCCGCISACLVCFCQMCIRDRFYTM